MVNAHIREITKHPKTTLQKDRSVCVKNYRLHAYISSNITKTIMLKALLKRLPNTIKPTLKFLCSIVIVLLTPIIAAIPLLSVSDYKAFWVVCLILTIAVLEFYPRRRKYDQLKETFLKSIHATVYTPISDLCNRTRIVYTNDSGSLKPSIFTNKKFPLMFTENSFIRSPVVDMEIHVVNMDTKILTASKIVLRIKKLYEDGSTKYVYKDIESGTFDLREITIDEDDQHVLTIIDNDATNIIITMLSLDVWPYLNIYKDIILDPNILTFKIVEIKE